MTKRIAIIGAGVCGITSAKACVEQNFEPVIFEKTDYTCGLWRYQENLDEDGIASVMKSTVINTSKEISAFSDFPPPIELSNYMHNSKLCAYFDSYGESFGFKKYVRFRHEILSLELADDFIKTGRWKVTYKNLNNGEQTMEIFDGVLVCIGHHSKPYYATFPGQEKFKGTIMHTHSLKHAKGFEDKTVVVVGIGNSSLDASVELATVTKQLYLSTRRGAWISKRVGSNGIPGDAEFIRRYVSYITNILPYNVICNIYEKKLNANFDHELYQLKPKHRVFAQHVTINDALANRILSGVVVIKSDIERFTADGVVFKGETKVTKCDAVILGTGYRFDYPFLSQDILPVINNATRLYKFQFIPNIKPAHTLAFIGLIQPIGAIFPIAELQARWYAQLMLGNKRLPTSTVMNADIDRRLVKMHKQYYGSNRHTIQVDFIPFMDELATEVGCMPPVWKYLFTDPKLFRTLLMEPSVAYQYRLVGPNSWKGARDAQIHAIDRIQTALTTNKVYAKQNKTQSISSSIPMTIFVTFMVFLAIITSYIRHLFFLQQ
ncbi:flavin-containing monooxygenase-like protein [Dermatophagoides farinae]|uniref:Flavin-containing monooxygenase n=1 Tax=Dermatophagoides farinae TaxID=6954 RepID=A0A9D4SCK1_DERFA|nr:flavin-containing monooxygenase 5-like [Dermatophagoides farinae]KAH7637149.1 flavin-containing monooxygenase-like protein [Dermatophagoides farinae]